MNITKQDIENEIKNKGRGFALKILPGAEKGAQLFFYSFIFNIEMNI